MEEDKPMERFKLLLGIFAVTVLVSGCATTSQTYDSSGKAAHVIKCGGLLSGWSSCYEKAGTLCGASGYTVVEKNSSRRRSSSWNIFSGMGSGSSFDTENRSLLITCKD